MIGVRSWTNAALFGTIWGALELSVGTALKLGRLPLSGLVMTLLGLVCLVTLWRLTPRHGVCLLAGSSAAAIKVFALGGFYPGPVLGILLEALLVEAGLGLGGGGRAGAMLAGGLATAANPLQMLLTIRIVAGAEAFHAYERLARRLLALAGIPELGPGAVLAALVAVTAAIGVAGGAFSWRLAGRVARRVGEDP